MRDYDEEDMKGSKFNEGVLQTIRIHKLQDKINFASQHLNHFFDDEQLYGYEIKFECINQLLVEVSSKLSPEEDEEIDKIKNAIEMFIEKNPIHIKQRNSVSFMESVSCDKISLNVLKKALFNYDKKVRKLLEQHGLGNPDVEDSGL